MKKKIYSIIIGLGALLVGNGAYAQIQDEQNVTVTMDLQPVLQLYMSTGDQINFSFDNVSSYQSGLIQYGATILKVSSTVDWDLYAVGTSTDGTFWDNQMTYGTTGALATTKIPLAVLELHQTPTNNATYPDYVPGCALFDYSTAFATPLPAGAYVIGTNNIYTNANPYTAPGVSDKYIAGGKGTNAGDQMTGGSYLQFSTFPSNYYYVIDYRLVPGLPVIFPDDGIDNCTADANSIPTLGGANAYAQPGVYTMDVKYVLLEDQ
jgi:hypothetical protein